MIDKMMVEAQGQNKEWYGAKSAKFTTAKKHLEPVKPADMPHPLFNMGGRQHYEAARAKEWEFKATKKVITPINHELEK